MPKPKTKDLTRRGTETTTQRVKIQMREAAGRDISALPWSRRNTALTVG